MRKPILLLIFLCLSHAVFASEKYADSLKQKVLFTTNNIDSLKEQLKLITDDSLKAPYYTQIASLYLKFDTIRNKRIRTEYQNAAISNTLTAIHYYSRYNDTTGLRLSFDNLAKVYHAQHKYTQAKWFILQSNTLSREKNDNPNIINSLIELAAVKSDIKDYRLAMRDLNEALKLSSKYHYPQLESQVQLNYALLYNNMKNYSKASIALKRSQAIDDSIKRDEEARMMAKLHKQDSLLQMKKKLYTTSSKRLYKISSSKRTVL